MFKPQVRPTTRLLTLLAGLLTAWSASSTAHAAPSLVLLEDNGDSNPVYRKTIESLGAVIVEGNLGHYYDHIDLLTGAHANRDELFAKLRSRGERSDVDLLLLTHGRTGSLSLQTGNITERDIRAAGPLPRLRMVYMMACYSASLLDAWQAAGARLVVGHQDLNSLSGFFFPRFLKLWGQGMSAQEASEQAYQFSEGSARALSSFIREDGDLLSRVGVVRSEPVLRGVDLDRMGHSFPDRALQVAPLEGGGATSSTALRQAPVFAHTDFEKAGIALLGAMIPQARLNLAAIPSAQELVDRVHGMAWDGLRDSFPDPSDGGVLDELGLPTEDGQQLWIDGESVRYFLGGLRDYVGDTLGPVMDHIQGVRMTRQGANLNVGIYFDQAFDIQLQDRERIPDWQPYSVHAPKTIRFSVVMQQGVLAVSGLDEGADALNLKLKMPSPLPEAIWVRNASVNLSDGKARVEAGVAGNLIGVVANAEITARKLDGIDIWASIARNLNILDFPELHFHAL